MGPTGGVARDALAVMSSGMTAFVHGAAATPTPLLDALAARSDLEGVNLYHLHTGGPAPFVAPECRGRLRSVSVFAGPPVRDAIERGDADFIPIIALPSTASRGTVSRIVPSLKPGAGVVTTRGHVHWVVTEHGAVNLFGLSLRQRAEALIRIAHPDARGDLRRAFAETRHITL